MLLLYCSAKFIRRGFAQIISISRGGIGKQLQGQRIQKPQVNATSFLFFRLFTFLPTHAPKKYHEQGDADDAQAVTPWLHLAYYIAVAKLRNRRLRASCGEQAPAAASNKHCGKHGSKRRTRQDGADSVRNKQDAATSGATPLSPRLGPTWLGKYARI